MTGRKKYKFVRPNHFMGGRRIEVGEIHELTDSQVQGLTGKICLVEESEVEEEIPSGLFDPSKDKPVTVADFEAALALKGVEVPKGAKLSALKKLLEETEIV